MKMRRNPERPIDRWGLDGLTSERKSELRDQWVEYAKSGNKNLENAILRGADLVGAQLVGAKLVGAILKGANLRGANLYQANLQGVNLIGLNLIGTKLPSVWWPSLSKGAIFPNYFKFLTTVGLTELSEIKAENSDSDSFFALRKFFRDRGQDEFGEFLEFEIRAEMDQVRREMGQ